MEGNILLYGMEYLLYGMEYIAIDIDLLGRTLRDIDLIHWEGL